MNIDKNSKFSNFGGGAGGGISEKSNLNTGKNSKFSNFGGGWGGYSGVNFGHLKSEVFQKGGGGVFWSSIPERGKLENLDQNLLFSQKPACASQ